MSRLSVTNFSNRAGSPYKKGEEKSIKHEEVLEKTHLEKQKAKQNVLLNKVNKKTAEYKENKPSSGVFTEVVTHGAFTVKANEKEKPKSETTATVAKSGNGSNNSKSLLGFPSSANDLALDAKSDLESDLNISKEVKEKVIEKLFMLAQMVQHVYESKVRIMTEYDKFKELQLKNESRREKEHSEQLYKLNMNFQNEVVQSIQRLKSELDISRHVIKDNLHLQFEGNDSSVCFNTSSDDALDSDSVDKANDKSESYDVIENNTGYINVNDDVIVT